MNEDQQQLRLLSIFHYVVAGLAALFSFFPLFYVLIGILFVGGAFPRDQFEGQNPEAPPAFVGWLFIFFGSAVTLIGWALASLFVVAGLKLSRNRSHLFCLVVAAIECLFFPFGTVLGIFTIIVLMRPSVIALFEQPREGPIG